MTQTLLFVDEEEFVRKALQRRFRDMRGEWNLRFAADPAEALAILASETVDVIVTETVFTTHDGLEFLRRTREDHPNSVRIILSGYADQDVILKSVDLAHQYLAKPCDDSDLKVTIARAFMMKRLLDNDALKRIVSRIDSLPSIPALYMELVEELESPEASIAKVGDIVAKDIGLTAKMLKLVNSAFFGLPQKISHPAKAVSLLGTDLIKAIVLSAGTLQKFKSFNLPGFSLDDLWQHSMTTAACCKIIAQAAGMDRKDADTAFMAGLLHDIGKLLVAVHMPEGFARVLRHSAQHKLSMAEAEMELLGTTHASMGAYLLGLWGLPDPIIEAAAYHHAPQAQPDGGSLLTAITHVSDVLANHRPDDFQALENLPGLDREFLDHAQLSPQLSGWHQLCVDILATAA